MADKFPGKDAGEKIAACIAKLPASGGVCDARNLTGEQSAESGFTVGSSTGPVELLLGAVHLTVTKTIFVQDRSSIIGLPSGAGIGSYEGATVLKAGKGSGLPAVVQIDGRIAVLQDITVDGNKAANDKGGDGILINRSWRAELFRVTVQNAPRYGLQIFSQQPGEACCAKLHSVMSVGNGKAGLRVVKTGDVFVSMSEFENNGTNGVEADGASGLRIEQSDLGGNLEDGLSMYGTQQSPSSFGIIVGNQFGNNGKADVEVAGSAGTYSSLGHLIAANEFIGSSSRPPGQYDAIRIVDGAYNVISGNSFFANPGHAYRSCVSLTGPRERGDQISNNYCHSEQVTGGAAFVGVRDTVFSSNQGRTAVSQSGKGLLFQ